MKLTQPERQWLTAIMEGFAPPGSGDAEHLAPERGEVDYAGTFEELNGASGPKVRYGIRAAALLIASSPVWMRARPTGCGSPRSSARWHGASWRVSPRPCCRFGPLHAGSR